MPIATKTLSLMRILTRADIEALAPWDRQQFAAHCRRFAELAEAIEGQPAKSGVVAQLDEGERAP